MPEVSEPFENSFDELIIRLRARGFTVGIDQIIAAQDVVLAYAADGGEKRSAQAFAGLLAPIFSKNPQQQALFQGLYRDWLAQLPDRVSRQSPTVVDDQRPVVEETKWPKRWPYSLLALLATVIVFAVAFIDQRAALPPPPVIEGESTTEPAPNLPSEPPPAPIPAVQQAQALPNDPQVWEAGRLTAAAAPVLLFVAWWMWRKRRRKVALERSENHPLSEVAEMALGDVDSNVFAGAGLRRALHRLRAHRYTASARIDVARSIDATLRRGGLFEAVYQRRVEVPEYVVLVDRVGVEDQRVALLRELTEHMLHEGLFVHVRHFHGDPRRSYAPDKPSHGVSLDQLAGQLGDQRLLIVAEPERFFDPVSGQLQPWTKTLAHWPQRALLNPVPDQDRNAHDVSLWSSGMAVLPLQAGAFDMLASLFSDGVSTTREGVAETTALSLNRAYPRLLFEDGERWLDSREGDDETLGVLLDQLRVYLGEQGMSVLAACALYPALHWHLTLYLDHQLSRLGDTPQRRAERLLRLTALPWFRHGRMPEFLRKVLLQQLPEGRQRRLRDAITELMQKATGDTTSHATLDIARAPSSGFRAWLRRASLLRDHASDSDVRDTVFADWLSRPDHTGLRFVLPRKLWRRLPFLFDETRYLAGLAGIALCVFVGGALYGWISEFTWRLPFSRTPTEILQPPAFATEPSVVRAPVLIDLSRLESELGKSLASNTRGSGRSGATSYNYDARVSSVKLSATGGNIETRVRLSVSVKTTTKVLIKIPASCSGEFDAVLRTRLQLDDAWSLRATSGLQSLQTRKRCGLQVLTQHVDVTDKISSEVRKAMASASKQLDRVVKQRFAINKLANTVWSSLQQPIAMGSGAALYLQPDALLFAGFSGAGKRLQIDTGAVVSPALQREETAPAAVKLPAPRRDAGTAGDFQVGVGISLDYAQAAEWVKSNLRSSYELGGTTVEIDAVRVFGDRELAVVALTLGGGAVGDVFYEGRLGFDGKSNRIGITSLRPRDAERVAAEYPWLLRGELQDDLRGAASWDLSGEIDKVTKNLGQALNRKLTSAASLQVTIAELTAQGVYPVENGFRLQLIARGQAKLDLSL